MSDQQIDYDQLLTVEEAAILPTGSVSAEWLALKGIEIASTIATNIGLDPRGMTLHDPGSDPESSIPQEGLADTGNGVFRVASIAASERWPEHYLSRPNKSGLSGKDTYTAIARSILSFAGIDRSVYFAVGVHSDGKLEAIIDNSIVIRYGTRPDAVAHMLSRIRDNA